MDESGVLELAEEAGVALRYWHVMDAGRDLVNLMQRLLDRQRLKLWLAHAGAEIGRAGL